MTPRATPRTATLFATAILAALLVLAAMVALPHDLYIRWQAVRTEAFARLGWVYERVHDDPTPVDIVFIGTSHTMNGIDAAALERRLAAKGWRAPDGRCLTATNLAIPSYGRNLQWLITRELLSARRPRLLVIEVFENESRKPHPLFASVATTRDILTAPALVNINYVTDILRLPWRQATLAIESVIPAQFGLKPAFRADRYDGSTVDNTRVVSVGGVAFTSPRDRAAGAAVLDAYARDTAAAKDLNLFGKRFEDYEYAVPLRYYGAMLALAKARGVDVALLYLPSYGQPRSPVLLRGLGRDRPMITAPDILADRTLWYDPAHLNDRGAERLTARVADELPPVPGSIDVGGHRPCAFGYPQRPIAVPFRGAAIGG